MDLTYFSQCSISIPPENVRKPEVNVIKMSSKLSMHTVPHFHYSFPLIIPRVLFFYYEEMFFILFRYIKYISVFFMRNEEN